MFLTLIVIVKSYNRKFEILGKYENPSPSAVSFIETHSDESSPRHFRLNRTVTVLLILLSGRD